MSDIFAYERNPQLSEQLPQAAVQELSLIWRALSRAGEVVRSENNKQQAVIEKSWGDLVSDVDVTCDQIIAEEIHEEHPNDVILSEELTPEEVVDKGRCWVVDPIDATSAWLFGCSPDMPACMLAQLENGVSQYSGVYFPLTDEFFYAVRGLGAYKARQRLDCANRDVPIGEAWVEMNQYSDARYESHVFRRLRENLRAPGGARLVSSSPPHSGVGVRIAEGRKRLSAVVHDNGTQKIKQAPWDVIPVALILQEAGGVVVSFNNQPYDSFKPEPFIMAASGQLAGAIIERAQFVDGPRPI